MTIPLTFRILLTFGTVFGKFANNSQLDATGTRAKQGRKGCGIGVRHGYVISFVFLAYRRLTVAWSFVGHKFSERDLVLHIACGYNIN